MLIESTLYHSDHKLTGSVTSAVDTWGFFPGDRAADSDSDQLPTSGAVVGLCRRVAIRSLFSISN
jgi:hypothetical protein